MVYVILVKPATACLPRPSLEPQIATNSLFVNHIRALGRSPGHAPETPLAVAIVIDQFRYDYLLRFRSDYNSGLARLLEKGAEFTDAHYLHAATVTAVGHSTFLTGAPPSVSGIISNEWSDRETGKSVTSASDPATKLVGGIPNAPGSMGRVQHEMFP
jgi:predicted AlkP superfamily pyrophosphatase or phosphodiesterase